MTTTFQIVDSSDLTTILFDFNSASGAGNPSSVVTAFGVGGSFDLGAPDPEYVTVSPTGAPGGRIVSRRDPLTPMTWLQRVKGSDFDAYAAGLGELGRLLAKGGTIKWVPSGSTEARYIDFEPSDTPALVDGRAMGLWQLANLGEQPDGVRISLLRQPYLYGAELDSDDNLLTNATLLHDFGGTANRPDDWTWDSTTGISGEAISTDAVNWGYQFTIADSGVHNLQQTTPTGTVAQNDVTPMQFEARVTAVAGTPQARCMVEYLDSGGGQIGSDQTTTITTLTTTWQRITLTPAAAGATTSKVRASIQIDNVDATSVTVQLRKAQVEVAAAPSLFRVGSQDVAFDPASATDPARMLAVYCQGNAPSYAELHVTADAQTLQRCVVHRDSTAPAAYLDQTMHKQLESGTLGTDTTSTSDSNGSGGNTALVSYTASSGPSLRADATTEGSNNTGFTISKPTGTAADDLLLMAVVQRIAGLGDNTWGIDTGTLPAGWFFLAADSGDGFGMSWWAKIATASEPSSYDFEWLGTSASNHRVWLGSYPDVDTSDPIDAASVDYNATGSTSVVAPGVTTSRNNNAVIGFFCAYMDTAETPSWTAPTGTTPTFTEQDDDYNDDSNSTVTSETVDGILATAGATGNKTATLSTTPYDHAAGLVALNVIASTFEARSTVTWTALEPGAYDLWMRFYPTVASEQRIRVEWAPMASPTAYHTLGDYILDTTTASTFEYVYRKFGRVYIPSEHPLDTLTVRVSAGLEDYVASGAIRLDMIDLVPANDHAGAMTATGTVASGEELVADGERARVFHLDSTDEIEGLGTADGAMPVELEPGLNLLTVFPLQPANTGYEDRVAKLTAAPTVRLVYKPRYR